MPLDRTPTGRTTLKRRFPYDETDDQLRCIQEIKDDMEKPSPMDRLLCGDVGFGKTEVAIRAAFKCVMDGKQCAVLVPTTILAWQHYQTFRKRMEGFPVKVDTALALSHAKGAGAGAGGAAPRTGRYCGGYPPSGAEGREI